MYTLTIEPFISTLAHVTSRSFPKAITIAEESGYARVGSTDSKWWIWVWYRMAMNIP